MLVVCTWPARPTHIVVVVEAMSCDVWGELLLKVTANLVQVTDGDRTMPKLA
jgi:hypothetical protein